jgi:hypothetical protein
MLFQPAQVHIDVLGPDVKSAPGHIRAQLFGWWIVLGLQKRADATRAAFPPHEAEDWRVLLSHIGREPVDRPWRKAGGFIRPIGPGRQIVRSDHIMIDPVNGSFWLNVGHK